MGEVVEAFDVEPLHVRIFPAADRDTYLVIVYDELGFPDDDCDGEIVEGLEEAKAHGVRMAEGVLTKRAERGSG